MFKRIVSQLSLSPSVAQNLNFYARRLKQESVTRTFSVIAAVLLVGLQFAVITAPPTASNAASPNDIIYGGITSKADLLAKYDASPELQALYNVFGISRADLANTTQTSINSRDHNLNSLGRLPEGIGYATISAGGTTFWAHHLYQFDTGSNVQNGSTYSVLAGHSSANGSWFAVMFACGNIVFNSLPTAPTAPATAAPVITHAATACLEPITGTAYDPLHGGDNIDPTTVNLKIKGISTADVVGIATTPDGGGYWAVGADGGVFATGDAAFHGSMGGKTLAKPADGIVRTADGGGYWIVAEDGGVFAFGDAGFHGSKPSLAGGDYIVGMAATPNGGGYWLASALGHVYAFGNAVNPSNYAVPALPSLSNHIVGITATTTGNGFWLVGADGGVFAYGDAGFHGSMGGKALNAPVTGMAATTNGGGYWLAAADGGVFAFGDAGYKGSMADKTLAAPITAMAATSAGYVLIAKDGGTFNYGTNFTSLAAVDLGTVKTSGPPSNTYNFPYSSAWEVYAKNGRTFEVTANDSAGASNPIDFSLPTDCTPTTTTTTTPAPTPTPTSTPTPTPATLSLHKTAFNVTQNIDATTKAAAAGDTIKYILSVTNSGGTATNYTFSDDFTSILQYADITDGGGSVVKPGSSTGISLLVWPSASIAPGQTVTRIVTVKVKNPVPATPVGVSDPKSYALEMDNLFGNNVTVKIQAPPAKQIETAAAQLPDTGAGTSTFIVLLFCALVVYFYARNRQLMTEIKILHGDYQGGS